MGPDRRPAVLAAAHCGGLAGNVARRGWGSDGSPIRGELRRPAPCPSFAPSCCPPPSCCCSPWPFCPSAPESGCPATWLPQRQGGDQIKTEQGSDPAVLPFSFLSICEIDLQVGSGVAYVCGKVDALMLRRPVRWKHICKSQYGSVHCTLPRPYRWNACHTFRSQCSSGAVGSSPCRDDHIQPFFKFP